MKTRSEAISASVSLCPLLSNSTCGFPRLWTPGKTLQEKMPLGLPFIPLSVKAGISISFSLFPLLLQIRGRGRGWHHRHTLPHLNSFIAGQVLSGLQLSLSHMSHCLGRRLHKNCQDLPAILFHTRYLYGLQYILQSTSWFVGCPYNRVRLCFIKEMCYPIPQRGRQCWGGIQNSSSARQGVCC